MSSPLIYEWNGDAMVPLSHFAKHADKQFVVHERYRLEVVQHRSMESHAHYFACLHSAFQNLPESQAGRFPTETHLRKWALVQAGYRNETTYIAHSKAEALRFASFLRSLDEYAVIRVMDKMVALYVAKSQSMNEMSKKEFQESKEKVLEVVAKLIGVESDELQKQAGRAA